MFVGRDVCYMTSTRVRCTWIDQNCWIVVECWIVSSFWSARGSVLLYLFLYIKQKGRFPLLRCFLRYKKGTKDLLSKMMMIDGGLFSIVWQTKFKYMHFSVIIEIAPRIKKIKPKTSSDLITQIMMLEVTRCINNKHLRCVTSNYRIWFLRFFHVFKIYL